MPILIDNEEREPAGKMECYKCKNMTNHEKCKAFEYIPDDIWFGKVLHRTPYPGDNGIQFEVLNVLKGIYE